MRVRIIPLEPGGTPVEFTGDIAEELADGFAGDPDWADEVLERVRAAEVDVRDLGNTRTPLSFTVTRSHDDEAAAAEFFLDHPGAVPRIGKIELTIVTAGNVVRARRFLAKARVKVRMLRWHVCETTMRYDIVGGALTKEA